MSLKVGFGVISMIGTDVFGIIGAIVGENFVLKVKVRLGVTKFVGKVDCVGDPEES